MSSDLSVLDVVPVVAHSEQQVDKTMHSLCLATRQRWETGQELVSADLLQDRSLQNWLKVSDMLQWSSSSEELKLRVNQVIKN